MHDIQSWNLPTSRNKSIAWLKVCTFMLVIFDCDRWNSLTQQPFTLFLGLVNYVEEETVLYNWPPCWPSGKASASRVEDPGFEFSLRLDFPGLSHTSDLKIGTQAATLPGAWCYRVSAGTDWPGVSILWLGKTESLICNFYLSVAARKIVWADPSKIHSHVAGTLSNQQTTNSSIIQATGVISSKRCRFFFHNWALNQQNTWRTTLHKGLVLKVPCTSQTSLSVYTYIHRDCRFYLKDKRKKKHTHTVIRKWSYKWLLSGGLKTKRYLSMVAVNLHSTVIDLLWLSMIHTHCRCPGFVWLHMPQWQHETDTSNHGTIKSILQMQTTSWQTCTRCLHFNNNNNQFEIFTISSLRHELSPTNTLQWPGHNRVQISCNTSSAYHVQHVVCHVVWRDSSATKLERVEITFSSAFYFMGWNH